MPPPPAEINIAQSTSPESRPFMSITNVEKLLAKLLYIIKNKTTFDGVHLSNDEAIAVVYYKWKDLDILQRQMAVEYMSELPGIICKENITDILLLYSIGFNNKHLLKLWFDSFNNVIKYVDFSISFAFDKLEMFLVDFYSIIDAKSNNHLIYIIQLIMNWAVSHPAQFSNVIKLFKEMCTFELPYDYVILVLFPYFRNLSTEDVNVCGKHELKIADIKNEGRFNCRTARLTSKMYMLQDDITHLKFAGSDVSYKVCIKVNEQYPLSVNLIHPNYKSWTRCDFILFDKDICMRKFPSYREQDLSIDELREWFAEYSNLHLMFFR